MPSPFETYRRRQPKPRCPRRYPKISFVAMYPKRTDGLCRCGCGEKLEGRQRQWRKGHEVGPVDLFRVAKGDSDTIRKLVAARDHGVCAICGLNTVLAFNVCGRWQRMATPADQARVDAEQAKARSLFLLLGFFTPGWCRDARRCSWWQADHIVPLIEGGANSLDNLRTACLRCHARETAALAARRARSRKPAGPGLC